MYALKFKWLKIVILITREEQLKIISIPLISLTKIVQIQNLDSVYGLVRIPLPTLVNKQCRFHHKTGSANLSVDNCRPIVKTNS